MTPFDHHPEGELLATAQNRQNLATVGDIERCMRENITVEGTATRCDGDLCLHVDLGAFHAVIPPEECTHLRPGEGKKDIAVISRVGKPVAAKITAIEMQNGTPVVRLSRRAAQKECLADALSGLTPGDIIYSRVTHMEPFGAFVDIGCGVVSLLSVDCISTSRISHPRDRLHSGMRLPVAVKSICADTARIYVTLRELLGTWEQNVVSFSVGETVRGILRSVEPYGVFVELAPNLAGLCEVKESCAEELKTKLGQTVAVYIKSILPERMKVKLVLVSPDTTPTEPAPLRFFLPPTPHISTWRYSPESCTKIVESIF